jgi:hypothetical protein
MRSSEDKEGLRLLNKWNTSGAEIRASFATIGGNLSFSARGVVVIVGESGLRFTGAGFEMFVDLSGAAFERVGTVEIFKIAGLDPDRYTESAEVSLGTGDKVIFLGPPGRDGHWQIDLPYAMLRPKCGHEQRTTARTGIRAFYLSIRIDLFTRN